VVEHLGYEAVIASNGRRAVELFADGAFDLVLMDVQMPEMDGFAATAQVRAMEAASGRHTPVLAVTAYAMQGDRERCLAAGMDGYVVKPLTSRELAETIRRFFPGEPVVEPPEPAFGGRAAAWDAALTLERLGGDENLLAEVVEIFVEGAPRRLADLRAAMEQREAETAARIAHSLKGEFGYLGIAGVAERARQMETLARAGDFGGLEQEFALFAPEAEAVLESMRGVSQTSSGATP
jgi:two-component system, sensor histidine kinase and response regulator